MAVHDYVIANGTGAAVRSDINDALAAIVSNNSSSSEPATTYAYQWWADTTANVLKIRNSANNAWITLRELDGTLLMEDGSNSAPGLSFASDTNTGFFRGGADKLNFATGGVERLEIGSSEVVFNEPSNDVDFRVESNGNTHMLFVDGGNNRVGIGQVPTRELSLHSPDNNNSYIHFTNDDTGETSSDGALVGIDGNEDLQINNQESSKNIAFRTGGGESARIDSGGRLLVGKTSADLSNSKLEVTGAANANFISILNESASDVDGNRYSKFFFRGTQSGGETSTLCSVQSAHDGSADDQKGRLTFHTNDGSDNDTPTERLRIDSSGNVGIKATAPSAILELGGIPNSGATNEAFTIDRVDGTQLYSINYNQTTNTIEFQGLNKFFAFQNQNSQGESMRIGTDGKILIGSTTASALGDRLLQVGSTSRSASYVSIVNSTSGTGGLLFADSTGSNDGGYRGQVAYQHSSDAMQFWTAGSERMRIANTGLSDIYGSSSTLRLRTGTSGSSGQLLGGFHSATSVSNGTQSLAIFANGNIQNTNNSYGSLSDAKLKENVVDANSQWDDIKGIRVRNYNFIEGQTHTQIGVVAQEVETVSPGLVTDLPDLDEEGSDLGTVTKSVNYSVLYMKAVKALQEAMDRIETLEAKVAALEAG